MGRRRLAPCCKVEGLNKGPWTPEEDMKLIAYVQEHGHENWRALPKLAGLLRCGKSCRLRWLNYLRPDVKRGNFTKDEEETIIKLHSLLGNKWSKIASSLPGRTDNEIKNLWHTHLKKRVEPNSTGTSSSSSSHKQAKDHTQISPSPCSYIVCAKCGTVNAKKRHASKPSEESVTFDKVNVDDVDQGDLTMEVDKCTAPGAHPPAAGHYRPESSLGSCMAYPNQFHDEKWVQGLHPNDESINNNNNSSNKRDLIEIPDINIDQEVLWGFMDDDYYSIIPEMAPLAENNVGPGVPYGKSIFGEESIEEFERSRSWAASRSFFGIN